MMVAAGPDEGDAAGWDFASDRQVAASVNIHSEAQAEG
jgi:hypothetical protein